MRRPAFKGEAHILLEKHMKELGIEFTPEYRFHPKRKWRFDYLATTLCPMRAAGVEIEGAIWTQGRHTRGAGYEKDLEKYREAAHLGWKVYRFSTEEVLKGVAREFLQREFAPEFERRECGAGKE